MINWPCDLDNWKEKCDDITNGYYIASIVKGSNRAMWIIGMVILSVALTQDCVEHMKHIRFVPWFWKFLLTVQCFISMWLCLLNAELTAGAENAADILMNSVGLLVLNDLDNIVGMMFV